MAAVLSAKCNLGQRVASGACAPIAPVAMKQRADKFFEATRAKGNEYFGESADNLTGVLVNLAPVKKPSLARPAPSAAPVETIKLKPVGQRL